MPPLYAAVLIGGRSRRMGTAKHLLHAGGRTWLEHTVEVVGGVVPRVVLVGAGEVPPSLSMLDRLADAPDAEGPMAGILGAMRSAPEAAWLITACDFPRLTTSAVEWLISERRPDRRAVVPSLGGAGDLQPLFAIYEPAMRAAVEAAAARERWRMMAVVRAAGGGGVALPAALEAALLNANAPGDLGRGGPR